MKAVITPYRPGRTTLSVSDGNQRLGRFMTMEGTPL
jgi:hypothetical protein